jgi:sugar/nucleoside kinase (ribokinase family)
MADKNSPHRPRTVSIGGATYDLFLTLGKNVASQAGHIVLHAGSKVPVERVVETCGGGACNTSVGLARLGCHASFCGVIGSDQWGEKLLSTMRKERVNTDPATIIEGEMSSFSIIMNLQSGERTILATPGASGHLRDVTFDLGALEQAEWVYLNRLSEHSCEIEDDIIRSLSTLPKIGLTWNPGGCQIATGMDNDAKKALVARTTLLLLNKEEALEFAHCATQEEALKKLLAAGAENVCITDGNKGTLAANKKGTYRCGTVQNAKNLTLRF